MPEFATPWKRTIGVIDSELNTARISLARCRQYGWPVLALDEMININRLLDERLKVTSGDRDPSQ